MRAAVLLDHRLAVVLGSKSGLLVAVVWLVCAHVSRQFSIQVLGTFCSWSWFSGLPGFLLSSPLPVCFSGTRRLLAVVSAGVSSGVCLGCYSVCQRNGIFHNQRLTHGFSAVEFLHGTGVVVSVVQLETHKCHCFVSGIEFYEINWSNAKEQVGEVLAVQVRVDVLQSQKRPSIGTFKDLFRDCGSTVESDGLVVSLGKIGDFIDLNILLFWVRALFLSCPKVQASYENARFYELFAALRLYRPRIVLERWTWQLGSIESVNLLNAIEKK